MLIYVYNVAVFTPVFAAEMGSAYAITISGMFLLQQLQVRSRFLCVRMPGSVELTGRAAPQWSVALVLMLYPIVVVGSLSADLRWDCSRTAALRLRQSSSSPDKEGLGPHHVRGKWLRQTKVIRLAEDTEPGAVVWRDLRLRQHMLYDIWIANIIVQQVLGSVLFEAKSESCTLSQDLQGFLVTAGSVHSQEAEEVSEVMLASSTCVSVFHQSGTKFV
ncbi:PqqA peptide cyclase [Frankliniella fusca]|uniref:PqqA peptide cyclase n=1 Tax=Frankliniella fusca TaxID=407009 RepID=A0AAE1L969_9NEOP|nr:PqqA peptide cyclase [Frankliniella fusca]